MIKIPCSIEPDSIWWKIVKHLRNKNRILVSGLSEAVKEVEDFVEEHNGKYISEWSSGDSRGYIVFKNDIDATAFLLRFK
jgi:hypothetical protein